VTDIDLINAAAREIASAVSGGRVPGRNPIIRFDEQMPYGDSFGHVVFPNWTVAAAFLTASRTDSQTIAASAFAHGSASPWARKAHTPPTTLTAPGADWVPDEVARLLAAGFLMLVPLDPARHAFRLVRRRRFDGQRPRRSIGCSKIIGEASYA
jgi:hypothetical protein